jgi:hypothetical protein
MELHRLMRFGPLGRHEGNARRNLYRVSVLPDAEVSHRQGDALRRAADAHPLRTQHFPSQEVTKTYCSFKAFNELYKPEAGAKCSSDEAQGTYVCAARGDAGNGAVVIVNRDTGGQCISLEVTGGDQ